MDREYLEDYEQKELDVFRKFEKRLRDGKLSFEESKYPPDSRFAKLQKPVAHVAGSTSFWAQIPFCGTLLLPLAPAERYLFEEIYFGVDEIPKVIDFIKETGRVQVVIRGSPLDFEKLDHLEPFFKELNPPVDFALDPAFFWEEKEVRKAEDTFITLGKLRYFDSQRRYAQWVSPSAFSLAFRMDIATYTYLKLARYAIVEEIENLMVDEPFRAFLLLGVCHKFIAAPFWDHRCDAQNYKLDEIRGTETLPWVYRPERIRFPCEIGKFLLRKLTYSPLDSNACRLLIDFYDAYDLQKVAESLNKAIVTNNPDILSKSAGEFSEILENVWNDKTIPKRIEKIEIGVPVSIAAIGFVAGGIAGGLSGGAAGAAIGGAAGAGMGDFLTKLGFKVGEKLVEKFFAVKGDEASEKLAKLRTESYQANVYDFKKKYKGKIRVP